MEEKKIVKKMQPSNWVKKLTLSTVHSNGTDSVLTKMLSNFEDETTTSVVLDFESVQNSRKGVLFELNIDNGTNNGTVYNGGRAFG
jgi:hypothetical protein